MSTKEEYTYVSLGALRVIADFLPSPNELALRERGFAMLSHDELVANMFDNQCVMARIDERLERYEFAIMDE